MTVAIIDYGMGNIASVNNAFRFLGASSVIVDNPQQLNQVKGIVLPGVGAFYAAMQNLQHLGLSQALTELVLERQIPFLGICLGMQLIASDSTELQYCRGLNWVKGNVIRISEALNYRVPHVGWNQVKFDPKSVLFNKIEENAHFYFDHSFHLQCQEDILFATCHYGKKQIASVEKNHIFAVQFHPEKSQRNGLRVLRNFLNYIA